MRLFNATLKMVPNQCVSCFLLLPKYSTKLPMCYSVNCEIESGASPGFGREGGQKFVFRFRNLHVACMSLREAMSFARGVRGHAPP